MKKVIIGLAVAVMAMVAGGCGTATGTGSEPGLNLQQQQTESGARTGSVRLKVSLYDQDATALVAPKRAGGIMRVQDIMKGMTKKFVVTLYEIDDIGNIVQAGLTYSSTADVVDGVADVTIQNVSAGRSYDLLVHGMDADASHVLFQGRKNGVSVSADIPTSVEISLMVVDMYWINDLVLSNISGNYQQGNLYAGSMQGISGAGDYSYTVSCTTIGLGKISCLVGVLTEETSVVNFSIIDADGVSHSYRIKLGIRDALDDNTINFDLVSGNLTFNTSFKLDVDQIYFDGLSVETNYVWYSSYGGLPIGIAVGDTLEFTYDDGGVTKSVAAAVVTAYADGSGFYCKIIWSQLPQSWWSKGYYTVKVVTPPAPV